MTGSDEPIASRHEDTAVNDEVLDRVSFADFVDCFTR